MADVRATSLDPPVDIDRDHVLGPLGAEMTLVEVTAMVSASRSDGITVTVERARLPVRALHSGPNMAGEGQDRNPSCTCTRSHGWTA